MLLQVRHIARKARVGLQMAANLNDQSCWPTGAWQVARCGAAKHEHQLAERELAAALVATRSGLDTLLTKGDGGRDGVFGFSERALAGLGWVNFR